MNSKKINTYKLIIKGKVQGVGFRYWFYQEANSLGLNGYVKNLKNENIVEAIIQGEINIISKILKKIKIEPILAKVQEIKSDNINSNKTYSNFQIK